MTQVAQRCTAGAELTARIKELRTAINRLPEQDDHGDDHQRQKLELEIAALLRSHFSGELLDSLKSALAVQMALTSDPNNPIFAKLGDPAVLQLIGSEYLGVLFDHFRQPGSQANPDIERILVFFSAKATRHVKTLEPQIKQTQIDQARALGCETMIDELRATLGGPACSTLAFHAIFTLAEAAKRGRTCLKALIGSDAADKLVQIAQASVAVNE